MLGSADVFPMRFWRVIYQAIVFCLFIFVNDDLFASHITCPDLLKIDSDERDIEVAVKKMLGFGVVADTLLEKEQLRFQQPFVRSGSYKLKKGRITRENIEGSVSRLECTYRGGSGNHVVAFSFALGFYFRQAVLGGNLEEGVWNCVSSDVGVKAGFEVCKLTPGYFLIMNQMHHGKYLRADLSVSPNSTGLLIHAGEYKAVSISDGYIRLFLSDHYGEHDVTAACPGAANGVLYMDSDNPSVIEISGTVSDTGVRSIVCKVNGNKTKQKGFDDSWTYSDWFGEKKRKERHDEYARFSWQSHQKSETKNRQKKGGYVRPPMEYSALDILFFIKYSLGFSEQDIVRKAHFDLGLMPGTGWETVREKYKKLALIHHPDRKGKEEEGDFIKMRNAYDVLKSAFKK